MITIATGLPVSNISSCRSNEPYSSVAINLQLNFSLNIETRALIHKIFYLTTKSSPK